MVFHSVVLALALVNPAITIAQMPGQNVPLSPPFADTVVAKVDGQPITDRQVLNAIDQIVQSQQLTSDQLKNKETTFFGSALNVLIENLLLLNEAKAKKSPPANSA